MWKQNICDCNCCTLAVASSIYHNLSVMSQFSDVRESIVSPTLVSSKYADIHNALVLPHTHTSLQDNSLNSWSLLVNMCPEKQFIWWKIESDLTANWEKCFIWHFMSLQNLTLALSTVKHKHEQSPLGVSQCTCTILASWAQSPFR
jgi:hypothetical protein